jgi:hypothetical protein
MGGSSGCGGCGTGSSGLGEPEQAALANPVEAAARGNYREQSFGTAKNVNA